jgi:hypothetical protein
MASNDPKTSGSTTRPIDGEGGRATPATSSIEVLQQKIAERAEQVAREYEQSGTTDPEACAEIGRLDGVLRAYQNARPVKKPFPWRVPLLAALTAVLVSLLLFVRVPCTEVTLDLRLSSLAFQLADGSAPASTGETIALTTGDIIATRVRVRGFDPEEGIAAGLQRVRVPPRNRVLEFTSAEGLAIGSMEIEPGTWVWISPPRLDAPLKLRFDHASKPVSITLYVPPEVTVAPPRAFSNPLGEPGEPYTLTISSAPQQPLQLELVPRSLDGASGAIALARISETFGSELPITGLYLKSGDPLSAQRGVFSSILAGTVYREALAGNAYELRRGEYLQLGEAGDPRQPGSPDWGASTRPIEAWFFSRLSSCRALNRPDDALGVSGVMTGISITPEQLSFQSQADTRSLTVGSRDQTRDLMPRLLEWLQANSEAGLFWSVFLYLFLVVLLPLLRFWGIQR